MKSLVSEVMEDQVHDAPRVERLLITIVLVNHPSPPGAGPARGLPHGLPRGLPPALAGLPGAPVSNGCYAQIAVSS
jgi:hypothetical protein